MSSAHIRALSGCVYVLGKNLEGRGWPVEIQGDPQKDAAVSFTVKAEGKTVSVASGANPTEGLKLTVDGKVEQLRQVRFDRSKNAMVGPNGQDAVKFLQHRMEKVLGKTPPAS